MRMLRWMCVVTKLGNIRYERIRGLKWHGHMLSREEHYVGRRAMVMKV